MSKPAKLARPISEKNSGVFISLNTIQREVVNKLYVSGHHGNSVSEVVRRLLSEAIAKHANP